MKVVVAGTGYVGLVTGVSLDHIGNEVTCVDINEQKIQLLREGISPIYEKDLEKLMNINKKRLKYTSDYKDAYRNADVIFIGVGTPEKEDGSANLKYLYDVLDQIIESITKYVVVVIKSTVPIGTNDEVEKYLNSNLKNIKVSVVSNPEFLAQGTAVFDTLHASRIVVGVADEKAKKIMIDLYRPLTQDPYNVPFLVMDRKSAEMVKYASNDFLALKISYINEIANFCEAIGADINFVTKGMSFDKRIGDKFLNAGIGYGGSCFPKDTKALYALSKKYKSEITTISSCVEVNERQKFRLLEKLEKEFSSIKNFKIAVLGLTFKAETDDIREAPSIDNIKRILKKGAYVRAYDPIGINNFKCKIEKDKQISEYFNKITYCDTIEKAIEGTDAVLIMTDWKTIKEFKVDDYIRLMKTPYVFDGRNCYNIDEMIGKKIYYNSIGRRIINGIKENKI